MARSALEGRDIARVAVFAAIIVVLGLVGAVPVPGLVPITAQTLGVMLAGAVLGWKRGLFAVLVVVALVAIGLPVLSGGRGGLGVFAGPTAGYLIGWIPGVVVTGLIAHAGGRPLRWWRVALACVVGGILVVYLFGVPVQSLVTGLSLSDTIVSSLAFLPGDAIKAVLATVLTLALQKAYPPAFAAVRERRARAAA